MEPVQAVVLPRGKSLDQCAEVLQRRKQGKLDPGKSRKCQAKGSSRKPSHNVFDFLNEKLRGKSSGEKAGGGWHIAEGRGDSTVLVRFALRKNCHPHLKE